MIKAIQIGMGPLGIKIAEFISQRNGIMTVAAVDKNPALIGKILQDLSPEIDSDVTIKESIEKAIYIVKPDVAILTTVSDMERITPQIEEILAYKIPIISTCEELSYPWDSSKELSRRIDEVAKSNQVAVLGTGVNPGFLMDALPSFLTSVSQSVESVHVKRYQNAGFRRVPFQKKIGAGLDLVEFETRKQSGVLRHVGLTESMRFIASAMGWELDKAIDEISPVVADRDFSSQGVDIKAGNAAGVCQVGTGFVDQEPKITLVFQATVGEGVSYDEIEIKGSPTIKSRIEGGVNGDIATCAITVNACRQILKAQPGLRTMADVPMVSYFD